MQLQRFSDGWTVIIKIPAMSRNLDNPALSLLLDSTLLVRVRAESCIAIVCIEI
jgi:hypothetical protein